MTFPKKTVYLAGTISTLTHDEARHGWREKLAILLNDHGFSHIHCHSPMRGKGFLKDVGVLDSSGQQEFGHVMATPAGVLTRDYNDVKMCDAMVACFLEGRGHPSLGTAMEYGFAHALQKPVIAIGEPDDPNITHVMMSRVAGYTVPTLEEAALLLGHLLTPGI